MKAVDMTGLRFGRLLVMGRAEKSSGSGQARWECLCDCGGTTTTHGSNLRRGKTRSCGCAVADANRERLQTHGMSRSHVLYETWLGIRRRCLSPTDSAYPRYGGRGIGIATEWVDDFERFARDVGDRPEGHTLDRIDNDGDYAPGNVRWATAQEQADNRGPVATLRRENAALLAEVERLSAERDEWKRKADGYDSLRAELDEVGQRSADRMVENHRLGEALDAVRALVAKGRVDFHNTEVTVDLPAIRAALDTGGA